MAKVVKEDDKYQQIFENLHRLETNVKWFMNNATRSYVPYFET